MVQFTRTLSCLQVNRAAATHFIKTLCKWELGQKFKMITLIVHNPFCQTNWLLRLKPYIAPLLRI